MLIVLAWVVVGCFILAAIGAGCAGFTYNHGPATVRRVGFVLLAVALAVGGPAALAVIVAVLLERPA